MGQTGTSYYDDMAFEYTFLLKHICAISPNGQGQPRARKRRQQPKPAVKRVTWFHPQWVF